MGIREEGELAKLDKVFVNVSQSLGEDKIRETKYSLLKALSHAYDIVVRSMQW